MPPIPSQRRAVTEETSSLSDDDVGFLYQVVSRAEGKPEVEQLPFRALFAAYDEVIKEHDSSADPGHACLRFLFKMGSKGVEGPTLFDKFENALQQMGIVMDFGEDPSTELNETQESEHYSINGAHTQPTDTDLFHTTNGTPITPRRRASFNTTVDIGEDATQKSLIERPSSRSSMSRLQVGKPDFSKPKLSPNPKLPNGILNSPDRTHLIAQFLDVGRRLISRLDSVQHKDVDKEGKPLTNGVVARSAVDHDRSKRMTISKKPRRSHSISSSDSFALGESKSVSSQTAEHDDFEKEEASPELLYRPQLSDLLRDASTFNMYRQRAICRRILTQWLKRAFRNRQIRETRETVAINRDRGTLLRQAFEPWRAIIQDKRHTARTERFFKHLEERSSRARDLYLMTKAFTHWAQLTSEEVARTSAARQHVLSVKYFNAWREITAVNELKAQRFVLQKPFNKWRKKISDMKEAESQAVTVHNTNLRNASYWQWFWGFCERRAPEWYDHRLKRRSLLYWLRSFRTNRERDHEINIHNRRSVLGSAFQAWSQRSKDIVFAQRKADDSLHLQALRETFDEWKIQARLAPPASQVSGMVSGRILQNALSKWVAKARMADQAEKVNRLRAERNAWTSWNDTLRCLALRARIDERLKMETLYKWILAERFQLMRRIHEQRIKREVFTRFVTNTRDTYTRLLFHAENHEEHRSEDLVRAKFTLWREQIQLQREREYAAFEFYAPRLMQESVMAWRSKHEQIVKMEAWARDADFYFLMKKSLKHWQKASLKSAKRRRQEAYAMIRRKTKINLASKAISTWSRQTQSILNMEQQAVAMDREKVLRLVSELYARWHEKTLQRAQDCQDADWNYFREIAFNQLIQMSETYVIRREMEDTADSMYRSHVLRNAGASLRKLSLRVFQMSNTAETAEAMRERTLRRHSRNLFRDWVEQARLKLEARDSPGPAMTPARFPGPPNMTPARFSNFGGADGGSALFDPWIQNPSETPFKLTDFTMTSQEPASATPLTTPNYMNSPSKRAARARALAQMSTTPATPLHTPFAHRLLRASASTSQIASSMRPRTGRRSSMGTSVRFVDDELPESPTDGRKSANRRL
ncbi:5'-3' exoribonuclease 2 [Penicillium atrosanguineum]|uniref:Sfi1 spindle body n=1 Tax=Penicillium atrosanguineum TaxID=1132637 RepID=A0A9W9QDG0_9EURO|nr:5'-3' exoribonuclease 2 [Penicillium atrosanguineum]KAJ5147043.1 Sfi1 spindle body [Penicillium atrosanguineum]KAJ5314476.1 5'-3' exoribonuclease 2 [Penicillium atrosanguineum]KAJ5331646.1 Sfi1 spindle body [Penicillium atrosanguineum]